MIASIGMVPRFIFRATKSVSHVVYVLSLIGMIAASINMGASTAANAGSRIKDIIAVEGVRENQLIGYGLVVGLNGTGDTLQNAPFTRQSLEAMLERLGINTRDANMRPKNVAAVMVVADLAAFARQGSRLDVIVSSLGDADDLRGGTLIATPLYGADGEVYAVAQGSVAVAGFTASGDAGSVTQGVPTSGRIANGAIVEREIRFELSDLTSVRLSLTNPDFTTARRIAQAINDFFGAPAATPLDPGTVVLARPAGATMPLFELVSQIEHLEVIPDQKAKVVIDERSGVIVIGDEVRIDTVAIAQGNLTIRISETPQVSQPEPFSEEGETVVVPRSEIEVDTGEDERLTVLETGVSLQDLVDGLNALGVGPRDMISILQVLKSAGAMQADLEIM